MWWVARFTCTRAAMKTAGRQVRDQAGHSLAQHKANPVNHCLRIWNTSHVPSTQQNYIVPLHLGFSSTLEPWLWTTDPIVLDTVQTQNKEVVLAPTNLQVWQWMILRTNFTFFQSNAQNRLHILAIPISHVCTVLSFKARKQPPYSISKMWCLFLHGLSPPATVLSLQFDDALRKLKPV